MIDSVNFFQMLSASLLMACPRVIAYRFKRLDHMAVANGTIFAS